MGIVFIVKKENVLTFKTLLNAKLVALRLSKIHIEERDRISVNKNLSSVICYLGVDDERNHKFELLEIAKSCMKSEGIISASANLHELVGGYQNISELILCNPKEDAIFQQLRFDQLRPDYSEKVGNKCLLQFDFKLKERLPSPQDFHYYRAKSTDISIRYLGTDKVYEHGLVLYVKKDDKFHCGQLGVGRIYWGLESGAGVNDESDIKKALIKLNKELQRRGKEIVDLEGTYKKILKNLDPLPGWVGPDHRFFDEWEREHGKKKK